MKRINKSGERADPCAVPVYDLGRTLDCVSMKMSAVSCVPTWSRMEDKS